MSANNEQQPSEEDDIAAIIRKARQDPEPGAQTVEGEDATTVFSASVDLEKAGIDVYDTSEEDSLIKDQAKQDGVARPQPPEGGTVPVNPAFEGNHESEMREQVFSHFEKTYDFGKVVVTSEEKDRFIRSGLHDEPMYFDVEIAALRAVVRVYMPTESHTESVISVLSKWIDEKKIGEGNMQWLHYFTMMHMWLQVSLVNGQPTGWFIGSELESATYREIFDKLYDMRTVEPIQKMSPVRHSALRLACRIAEHKYKQCLEALLDRSFFDSAGIN